MDSKKGGKIMNYLTSSTHRVVPVLLDQQTSRLKWIRQRNLEQVITLQLPEKGNSVKYEKQTNKAVLTLVLAFPPRES